MVDFKLIRIHDSSSLLYAVAEKIWKESFPECERRDAATERLCVDTDSRFFFNAVVKGNDVEDLKSDLSEASGFLPEMNGRQVVGMFTWWRLEGMVYGEHFAMSPSVRGKGIGEAVFRSVTSGFQDEGLPFVFEVETPDPSAPITVRRAAFYSRCGMYLLDYPYFQPKYHPCDTPVPMRLMSSSPNVDSSLVAEKIRSVYPVF